MMKEYDAVYPGYDFAKNKGYGTKAHIEGIKNRNLRYSQKNICKEIHIKRTI